MTDAARVLPLNGVKVVDLGIITAGAGCSALLADFGAEVVKVESGSYPDPFRFWSMGSVAGSGSLDGSAPFNAMNRNKLGLCLDLKTELGRETLLRLVAEADVVIENFRRGVMERLGLSIDDLLKANPKIVLVSITSQGDRGPERGYGSYGSTLEAISGLASVTGYDESSPKTSGADVNYPDQHGALLAAGLTLAAVRAARVTGKGRHLVLSQREMVTSLIGEKCLEYTLAGKIDGPNGNRHTLHVPHGVFRCSGEDNWIAIDVATDEEWAGLAKLIDADAIAGDLSTAPARRNREDEIEAVVASWAASRDKNEAVAELRRSGVPAEPVLCPAERHDASQFRARGFFRTITHPVSGDQIHRGSPFLLSGVEIASRPAPCLGEHTEEVLAGAGLGRDQIKDLEDRGVTRNS